MNVSKKTYELDLRVDGLINNYKKAISVMRSEGAGSKTLAPLEKSLESIEAEFLRLQKIGKDGVPGDPAAIQSYEREIQNVYKRLERLGNNFEILSKNTKNFSNETKIAEKQLSQLQTTAEKNKKTFAKSLENLGFSKEQSAQLSTQITKQEQLNEVLERERLLRTQIRDKAEQDLTNSNIKREAAEVAGNRFGQNFFRSTSGSAGTLTPEAFSVIKQNAQDAGISVQKALQKANVDMLNLIQRSEKYADVMRGMDDIISTHFHSGMKMSDVFGSVNAASGQIHLAMNARQNYIDNSELAKQNLAANKQLDIIGGQFGTKQTEQINAATNALKNYAQSLNDVNSQTQAVANAKNADIQRTERLSQATMNLSSNTRQQAADTRSQTNSMLESAKAARKTANEFSSLKSHILMFFSVTSVISIFRQQIRKTFEDVKSLDKSFASIAMVTSKSVGDMWNSYNQYANMAIELGQKTQSVIDASALFYQQGLEANEALELTADTMKLATLAGIDYSQATDEMTAAIRGFRMEMDQGSHITDVYSTLAASAAASVNEIAQAMVRTSSIANSAGMSFENTAAFLTQMIETTQESAEN